MSRIEKGQGYHIDGTIEGVVDERGIEGTLVNIHKTADLSTEAVLKDLEKITGTKFELIAETSQSNPSQFGFSGSWKCPWEPEGPRPNWIDPKKSN